MAELNKRVGIVAVVWLLLVAWVPSPAFAGRATTSGNGGNEPGTVLSVAPMNLSATLANVATGKRITYVSRDSNNHPIVVSGAVLTPRATYLKNNPKGANKIVAWAHGTAGIADQCAPSAHPNLYPDPTHGPVVVSPCPGAR
jgi:hypothetical protein